LSSDEAREKFFSLSANALPMPQLDEIVERVAVIETQDDMVPLVELLSVH
jgi:hypothetical protein